MSYIQWLPVIGSCFFQSFWGLESQLWLRGWRGVQPGVVLGPVHHREAPAHRRLTVGDFGYQGQAGSLCYRPWLPMTEGTGVYHSGDLKGGVG